MSNRSEAEELLSRFPINEAELQRLLELFPHLDTILASGKQVNSSDDECIVISELNRVTDDDDFFTNRCRTLEKACLPELVRMVQYKLKTSYFIENESGGYTTDEEFQKKVRFMEAFVSLLGRRGDDQVLDVLFQTAASSSCCCSSSIHDPDAVEDIIAVTAHPKKLISLVYRLTHACCELSSMRQSSSFSHHKPTTTTTTTTTNKNVDFVNFEPPKSWVEFLSFRTGIKDSTISIVEWKRWAAFLVPNISRILCTTFHYVLLGPQFECKPNPPFQLPLFKEESRQSTMFELKMYRSIPMQLGLMDLGGPIHILYNSLSDGLSFPLFQQSLIGYKGSTLILIETNCGNILGYFSEIPWKTSSDWFSGEGESFLFQLYPSWNVYYPVDNGLPKRYHQFLHNPVSFRKGQMAGLAVGGITSNTPRLHISNTLERCKASSTELLFECGPLLAKDEFYFDISTLEVWAVRIPDVSSYKKCVQQGELRLAIDEATRKRCAKVDRAEFLDDFKSGAFINQLFDHRQAARGRADFVAAYSRGKGYWLDGKSPSEKYIANDKKK